MPDQRDPHRADVEEASSKLSEGLKNCRAMIDNYRAMIGAEPQDAASDDDAMLAGHLGHLAATDGAHHGGSPDRNSA